MARMSFEQYVAAINALAARDGFSERGKPYCDAEAWRDAYDDGLTPSEAWADEKHAAATNGG